jgi:hypothetical protein
MEEQSNSTEQQCNKQNVNRSYCVRRHMFFAVTNPIVADNLTKEEAEKECEHLNAIEQDYTYVHYEVHNCG